MKNEKIGSIGSQRVSEIVETRKVDTVIKYILSKKEICIVRFAVMMCISIFFMNLYVGDYLIFGKDPMNVAGYFKLLNYTLGVSWGVVIAIFYGARQ